MDIIKNLNSLLWAACKDSRPRLSAQVAELQKQREEITAKSSVNAPQLHVVEGKIDQQRVLNNFFDLCLPTVMYLDLFLSRGNAAAKEGTSEEVGKLFDKIVQ
eukprot:gene2480-5432_t